MPKIISIHSFRGGTGKSNTAANLAALLAMDGYQVGVVDTDIQSPGIHVLFDLQASEMDFSLNDYLWDKCSIEEAAYDVSHTLPTGSKGRIYLIPSSIRAGEIARILREGYDIGLLNDGFRELIRALDLDFLLIDTHPGLNEETLLSIAISDALAILLRPDQQDYQGTAVTVEVARRLDVPRMVLILNKVPSIFDPADVKARVEKAYQCDVAAILPHAEEMLALASSGLFVQHYPHHPITSSLRKLLTEITS